jgi:hypothetical protein
MTEPSAEEWWAILGPFFENSKDDPPEVKALALLLRQSDTPLPGGVRRTLAEILDSQLPYKLACNWQLQPVWLGRYDEETLRDKGKGLIQKAMATEPNISEAINAIDMREIRGMRSRTLWKIWGPMKRMNAWLDKQRKANPLTEEQKKQIRRVFRGGGD